MALREHWPAGQSALRRRWFGIWGVRDYYTRLEELAKDGAEITFGFCLIALASALLATGGLLLNSVPVVIGSMCVAPFLGPSRSVCIGALFGDRRTLVRGLVKQLLGLFIAGTGMGYVTTVLLRAGVAGVQITPEVLLRAMPAARDAVLTVLIAVTAGAAASLALSAEPSVLETPARQIIDTMIGVEIAISLIPPASVIGIGLAFGRPDISRNALLLLVVNVLALDIIGSIPVLALRGVRVQYLRLEKAIRQAVGSTLTTFSSITLLDGATSVTLLSPDMARVHVTVRSEAGETVPASLAQTAAAEIEERAGCRSEVTVDVIPCQTHSTL